MFSVINLDVYYVFELVVSFLRSMATRIVVYRLLVHCLFYVSFMDAQVQIR